MHQDHLIELRIGPAKWKLKDTTRSISRKFRLGKYTETIPHIPLYGPFTLRNGIGTRQLLKAIEDAAQKYDYLSFTIDGWERKMGKKGWVLAYHIEPSNELKEFSESLIHALNPITHSENPWDHDPSATWFHCTLANRVPEYRMNAIWDILSNNQDHPHEDRRLTTSGGFSRIFDYIRQLIVPTDSGNEKSCGPVYISQDAIRVTVLRSRYILAEYDLMRKQWLSRREALNKREWQHSLRAYSRKVGIELADPTYNNSTFYFISDLHLGHANIVRYCCRPFIYSDQMYMRWIRS